MDSWFEGPNDIPGKGWSLKDFLLKPEEPLGDLGFFGPDLDIGNEQPGISQLQNGIQYNLGAADEFRRGHRATTDRHG